MDSPSPVRAQGALEYLLLIGGAVLMSTIVLLIIFSSSSTGNTIVNNSLLGSQNSIGGAFNNSVPPLIDPFTPLPVATPIQFGSGPKIVEFDYQSNNLLLSKFIQPTTAMQFDSASFWEVTLVDAANAPTTVTSSTANVPVMVNSSPSSIQFRWNAIPVGVQSMRVIVTINQLSSGDFEFFIRVDKPSGYDISTIIFPSYKIAANNFASTAHFAYPFYSGRVGINPFQGVSQNSLSHPGDASMQFFALYESTTKDGLYWSSLDGSGYKKNFKLNTSTAGLEWRHEHFVPIPTPNSYTMPYPIMLSSVSDGWYEAARKYRSWAQTQPMTARGKWADSSLVSSRAKDVDFLFLLSPQNESFNQHSNFANEIIAASDFFNTGKLLAYWYRWHVHLFDTGWPQHLPKSSFLPALSQVQNVKPSITLMPYFNPGTWDAAITTQPYSFTSIPASRFCWDVTGAPELNFSPTTGWNYTFMDPSQQPNKDHEKSVIDDFTTLRSTPAPSGIASNGFGVNGIYYDYYSGLSAPQCYNDVSTGHSKNGGNYWTLGKKDLLAQVRLHARQSVPDFMISSESMDEFLIPSLDMIHSSSLYQVDLANTVHVPLWHVVYHDYILSSNLAEGLFPVNNTVPLALLQLGKVTLASIYTEGKLFSVLNWHADNISMFVTPSPEQISLNQFAKNMVDAYAFTRPFVLEGEMLAPIPGTFTDTFDYQTSLLNPWGSSWRSNNGKVGVVLVNPLSSAMALDSLIPLTDYGFSSAQGVSITMQSTSSPTPVVIGSASGQLDLSAFVIPSNEVVLLKLE